MVWFRVRVMSSPANDLNGMRGLSAGEQGRIEGGSWISDCRGAGGSVLIYQTADGEVTYGCFDGSGQIGGPGIRLF